MTGLFSEQSKIVSLWGYFRMCVYSCNVMPEPSQDTWMLEVKGQNEATSLLCLIVGLAPLEGISMISSEMQITYAP